MTIKLYYPHIDVDIILPNEINKTRLQKNNVNFILGYDCINAINDDPYVKKFSNEKVINYCILFILINLVKYFHQ